MSMTYYAVTDDPNELAHFGIPGMKWGVRHDKPRHSGSRKPRSAAYKKAQNKLGRMMKSGIKKAEAHWREYNSPENKQFRAARRYDRQTNKALEKARKGKLKYGKLDDWQVQRITERLDMERQARMLSETEKSWGKRLRQSIGEGIIQGVGNGAGRIASEAISRRSTLKTERKRKQLQNEMDIEQRRRMNAMDLEQQRREMRQRYDLEREHELEQLRNTRKDAKQKARNEVNTQYYLEAAKRGYNPVLSDIRAGHRPHLQTNATRAKQLSAWNERNAKEERKASYYNAYDKAYAVKRAEAQVKLDAPVTESKPKKEKKKDKNKGPGASQTPVSIAIYGSGYNVKRTNGPSRRDIYKGKGRR